MRNPASMTRTLASAGRMAAAFIVIAAMLVAASVMPAHAAKKKSSQGNPRYAAFVMDADTGAVLYSRYADKRLHPASLVKMMTLLMAFEALDRGELRLSDRITMSRHAAAQQPSKLNISTGKSIRVEDAIYALVTKSANDVAVAMGEALGGTESNFAAMMTARARQLGMNNTTFKNASGLHNPAQVSSARDMAILARHLINNEARHYHYFSKKNFSYNGVSHRNHNRLMETYKGMDGLKTGFIGPSGFNLAASAMRNNRRLIAVVFGGRTTQTRNAHVADLLDRGFRELESGNVVMARAPATDTRMAATAAPVPVRKPGETAAATQTAEAVPGTPFENMMGQGDSDPTTTTRIETGMMAVNAMRDDETPSTTYHPQPATQQLAMNTAAMTANETTWSVQIGAFTSKVKTDQLLSESRARLPEPLARSAETIVVPLSAGNSTVYRARLRGFSREQAAQVCRYFADCMTISPRAF